MSSDSSNSGGSSSSTSSSSEAEPPSTRNRKTRWAPSDTTQNGANKNDNTSKNSAELKKVEDGVEIGKQLKVFRKVSDNRGSNHPNTPAAPLQPVEAPTDLPMAFTEPWTKCLVCGGIWHQDLMIRHMIDFHSGTFDKPAVNAPNLPAVAPLNPKEDVASTPEAAPVGEESGEHETGIETVEESDSDE